MGPDDDMPRPPLVQEAFEGMGDIVDEVGRLLGVRRACGRVARGEPRDALANTVAFTDTGGLGNRRR